ncbi:MAG: putative toxin-antitoxin system toxin component, PIN family [Thermoanaerobaculia bacterium]|nr:putative toxin-antitoxin system toxin component, PIN family [Thermoanaerobaculia bacterium]
MPTLPQVVLDTNVLVSAQRSSRGAAARLVSLIGTGRFDIHVSVPLVLEYEDVLLRHRAVLGLGADDVGDLVDAICSLATQHEIYFLWRPFLRDAGDELVLELAIKARCSHIVTYNLRDFHGAERFGVAVVEPRELLRQIGGIS